jgi:hypothetical protein
MIYDTLKLAKTLRDDAHFPQDQAEGLANALNEAVQDNLATKGDIAGVRTEIAELRAATKADVAELKSELLKWIIGAIGLQTVVVIGAIMGAIATIVHFMR